ncbi:MAG: c-type cytochrome [Acidobacteriaceae bacterium]|nr:c-type cytochrome [Acidobacteriaceae bacterium]MBV8569969.1 c-type cytochrome [Acidobacteriaceae bacterium]
MQFRSTCIRAVLAMFAGILAQAGAQTQTPATPAQQTPQAPPTPKQAVKRDGYPEYDPAAVQRGQKTFVATCAFCHGSNAKGGETGPDLLRSVVVLDDENGNKIGQVVLNGRPDKGMPKFALSHDQIVDIAIFLHDRVKAAALRDTYKVLNIVVGDPRAGQAYFNGAGGCTSCHSVRGDLAHIGSKYDAVGVQQHIVMPREEHWGRRSQTDGPPVAPVTATVTLASGESFKGRLTRIDDFTVSIVDANGDLHSFTRNGDTPKVDIHDPMKGHFDLLAKYTDSDIHNLTAYLVTLK